MVSDWPTARVAPNNRRASRVLSTTTRGAPGSSSAGAERPALGRLAAQHLEQRPDRQPAANPLGAVRPRDDALGGREASHRLECRGAAHPVVEVAGCRAVERLAAVGVVAEDDQPSRVGKGQRLQHHPVHDAEDGGVGADGQGDGADAHGGEAGAAPQQADHGTEVLGEGANHAERSPAGSSAIQIRSSGRRARRVAALAPGEAEQRGQLARRQPGRGQPSADPARRRAAGRTRRPAGRRAGRSCAAGSSRSAARVEADGEPGHRSGLARRQPLLPRHLDGALQACGLGAGHRQPGRQQVVVAAARVVVAGDGPGRRARRRGRRRAAA